MKKSYTPKFKGDTEQLHNMRAFIKHLRLPDESYNIMIRRVRLFEEDTRKEMERLSGDIDWEDLAAQARITEHWIKEIDKEIKEKGEDFSDSIKNKYDLKQLERLTEIVAEYAYKSDTGIDCLYEFSEFVVGNLIIYNATNAKQVKDMTEQELEELLRKIVWDNEMNDLFDHCSLCCINDHWHAIEKWIIKGLIAKKNRW